MTVKERLYQFIEAQMTDEEAAELLAQLEWDSTEFEELTPAELAEAEAGREENERGDSVDAETVFRELGI